MASARIGLWIQFVFYALIPMLYVQRLMEGGVGMDSDMGRALYPGINFSDPATRNTLILLLTNVLRHVILLGKALFLYPDDAGFVSAAVSDARMFHATQMLIAPLFCQVEDGLSNAGFLQFLGTHGLFLVIMLVCGDVRSKQTKPINRKEV